MNSCVIVTVLLCLGAFIVRSEDMKSRSAYGGMAGAANSGGYGGGALPCAKNYLFSCQPNLQPAPCAQAAIGHGAAGGYGGGGGAGAYSENYPVYILPVPQYVNGYQTN